MLLYSDVIRSACTKCKVNVLREPYSYTMQRILIADDDTVFCNLLERLLSLAGYIVLKAGSTKAAKKILQQEDIYTVLLNANLPDGSGVAFTREIKAHYPAVHVLVLTAHADITSCVRSIKNGADDYILKVDDTDKLIALIKEQMASYSPLPDQPVNFGNVIGKSPLIKKSIELAEKVAHTNTPVLLTGETGTGKEIFARAIHDASPVKNQAFVAMNCASFSRNLLESELFGYKAGAFTDAARDKKGLIEEADGGTLFLDEIGEMNTDLQSKLLRFLETGEFIKTGDTRLKKVNIRFISATNRNLSEEMEKGVFREDLFYRLNVFNIELPPLRERKGDIILLAEYFIKLFSKRLGKPVRGMTDEFSRYLQDYTWKGNVRELRNIIERSVILSHEDILTDDLLPFDILSGQYSATSHSPYDLSELEKTHIFKVLTTTHWNRAEAARLMNISVSTLYRKISEYMLSPHQQN